MSKYTVSTDAGDYEVWAANAEAAKREVYYLTNGRASYMVVRRTI